MTTTNEGSTIGTATLTNLFECLTDEMLFLVLSFVPPEDLLRKVCTSCTRFAAAIQSDTFWIKSMPSSATLLEKANPLVCILNKHQLQRYSLFDAAFRTETKTTQRLLQHGSLLCTRQMATQLKRRGRRTCAASTTDNPTEGVENILKHADDHERAPIFGGTLFGRFGGGVRQWWSSTPTPEPDTRTEVLLFTTRAPLCLLTKILVKPLLDPYVGHVVYSWKFTKICAYLLPNEETKLTLGYPCTFSPNVSKYAQAMADEGGELPSYAMGDSNAMENLLSNQKPVYENTWPVLNRFSNCLITVDLPAKGVLANVVTVELIGKVVEQTPGSGYYACVDLVDCMGIPLHADHLGAQTFARER